MTKRSVVSSIKHRVTEGRFIPGEWCVEILNKDGGYEVVMFFRGPEARAQATAYCRDRFGEFEEINPA